MNDFHKKEREGERGMEVYERSSSFDYERNSDGSGLLDEETRSMPHQRRELNGGATWLGTG